MRRAQVCGNTGESEQNKVQYIEKKMLVIYILCAMRKRTPNLIIAEKKSAPFFVKGENMMQ